MQPGHQPNREKLPGVFYPCTPVCTDIQCLCRTHQHPHLGLLARQSTLARPCRVKHDSCTALAHTAIRAAPITASSVLAQERLLYQVWEEGAENRFSFIVVVCFCFVQNQMTPIFTKTETH